MEAPKLPSIFKQNRARGFGFKPLYYDEQKERLEELKKRYNEESEAGTGERRTIKFKSNMDSEWQALRQKNTKSSNIRLFAIIVLLFLITYLIITY